MSDSSSLPSDFLDRINMLFLGEERQRILASFCDEKPISFRVNTLRTSLQELISQFNERGISVESVAWYKDAFIYNGPKSDLTSLSEYADGKFYIQGLSSMIPALALDPQISDIVLDLAAAPGSKTTQIATLMHNESEITANDMSRTRLFKLRDKLRQKGVANVRILNLPGEKIWKRYPEYFDKVLVDVPCSMEGRFKCDDPDSYQDWSIKKVKELAHRQQYLLRSAITATKVGGTIIYSTCTLSPEENEGVIDWVLEKEGDAITIEKIEIPHLELNQGITTWKNKDFNPEVNQTARINPGRDMEGFFIAKIKKNRSTLTPDLLKQLH
ncbi:RsmB/NOP family class I SAM-dependent RNA methyltransferase [soil metagenome]